MFDYKTDETLEEIGRGFLRKIGLEHAVRPDMLTIIMKIKGFDGGFNYRRVPDAQLPNAEAHWFSDDRELTMRESIFVGIQRDEPRPRFTVAHEISHYALGHKGFLNRSTNQMHKNISSSLVKHQESEANRLAAILLAPEHLVPEDATAEQIETKFGLSITASLLRKEEIDRIRRRRRGELRPLPESVREFLRQAKREGMTIRTNLDD
ncbi:ImmA/IrrE family metallo-endopeptidase [Bradyrhizobium sp. S69]|uniref:ImmA/IrrE family metallo-endopeptidase n=1 Tax=Bradyrhizobium sp. S69 TaxID=1641856 RepID=UPI00131B83FA|nr:ImmA/IrrE family metallo-endopeptidase [Bradyrhizobium sp. S69]